MSKESRQKIRDFLRAALSANDQGYKPGVEYNIKAAMALLKPD
jgi:hypothetical protein